MSKIVFVLPALCAAALIAAPVQRQDQSKVAVFPEPQLKGSAGAALRQAAGKSQYLFILFYKKEDSGTQKLRQVLADCVAKWSDKAASVSVNVTDRAEHDAVEKFDVSDAPMPLVLAIAPNGAVTGGFPKQADEARLAKAFVSRSMAACLRHLQNKKMVFLAVQNQQTRHNDSALRGVRAVKADTLYADKTEIVTVDPSQPEEAKTLQQFKVDPKTRDAVTVLLCPPGTLAGTYVGATSKDELVTALKKQAAGGCSGKSGCCPK